MAPQTGPAPIGRAGVHSASVFSAMTIRGYKDPAAYVKQISRFEKKKRNDDNIFVEGGLHNCTDADASLFL